MIRLIDLLREAKQVGILYHYTIYENAVDILKDSKLKSGMSDDNLSSISFTRDKNFHKQRRTLSKFMEPQCRFTFDGDKLSNKYKISPYAQGAVGDVDPFAKSKKGFEAEERITSDKPFTIPLNNYLISFDMVVDYKDQSEWWFRYEDQADAIKLCIEKKVPINMVDKNGSPIPYKERQSIWQRILKSITPNNVDENNLDGYSLSIKKIGDDYFVLAKKGNTEVGKLSFIKSKFKPKLIATSVVVDPNYRRLGIATTMYNFAENKLHMKFIPNENVLTPDGKKFWSSRNK